VCEIELQAGEDVLDVALGDAVRWHAEKMESGPPQARVPHLIVKPTDFDVSTNLVITTTRRVYHLGLISTKEETPFYHRSARFHYPHELVAQWKTVAARAADEQRSERAEVVERGLTLRPDELNFGYEVSGDKTLWRPSQVFDDGTRVYLRKPASMSVPEAPALFVLSANGEKALVNHRLRGTYYVVDRLFERAVLVLGVGRHQERVEIARLGAEEEKPHRSHRSRRPGGRPGR
jgi:type IV secretion system protein VirB9